MASTVRSFPIVTVGGGLSNRSIVFGPRIRSAVVVCAVLLGSSCEIPAINRQCDSSDVARFACGQPDDRLGNLFGLCDASERVRGHEALMQYWILRHHVCDQWRVD